MNVHLIERDEEMDRAKDMSLLDESLAITSGLGDASPDGGGAV